MVSLYQVCSSCHDLSKNMAVSGWGLLSLYSYIKHFKNLFVRNHWTDFYITWQNCSFGDPQDSVQAIMMLEKKTWPLGSRAIKFMQKS